MAGIGLSLCDVETHSQGGEMLICICFGLLHFFYLIMLNKTRTVMKKARVGPKSGDTTNTTAAAHRNIRWKVGLE